jgi:ketopantoate reductase
MNFRIAVVGSGAIGSYYGAKLAYGGSGVHFLMRGDLNEVRAAGLYVRGKSENFRLASMPRLEICLRPSKICRRNRTRKKSAAARTAYRSS